MTGLPEFTDRLHSVRERLVNSARSTDRDPAEIRLLLATKTQPAARVTTALEAAKRAGIDSAGINVLVGENRVQELVSKAQAFSRLAVTPHLVGPLQSNKANRALDVLLANNSSGCVESLASADLARRLGERAVRRGRVLDVMLQVNVSREATKGGVAPQDAVRLAGEIGAVRGLRLIGLMTIGAHSRDPAVVRPGFAMLRALRDAVLASGQPGTERARELSMGMSSDLELAIAEGSTIVRVGTAVFGPRSSPPGA